MEYGAIDLHAKESQIRIIDQEGRPGWNAAWRRRGRS
jgi:hypothetical protein